jgi:hypothetical protein
MPKRSYSLEAPDQARLKIARAEIAATLKKHDLGGVVVLHTPGMAEFFYDMTPSYSCAWLDEQAGAVRMRSKLADYGGDAEAQRSDQAATAQLVHALGEQCGLASLMFMDIARVVNATFGAEHTPARHVPESQEGNQR